MDADRDLTPADRVMHLLRHLGIARAHFLGGPDVVPLPWCGRDA